MCPSGPAGTAKYVTIGAGGIVWTGASGSIETGAMATAPRRLVVAVLASCLLSLAVPAGAAEGDLTVGIRASTGIARVGDKVRFAITLENAGVEVIRSVTVRAFVDDELDVVSVPILDRVQSAGLSEFQGSEEIFWTIRRLQPGEEVTVVWKGVVHAFGNGRLDNAVTAEGSDGSGAEASSTVFLFRRCLAWRFAPSLT